MVLPPGVRRFAAHDDGKIAATFAPSGKRPVAERGLDDEAEVVVRGGLLQEVRRTFRTDLFVGVDEHFPADVFPERALLKGAQGVQHADEPALEIGDSGTVHGVLVEHLRGLEMVVGGEHGVHMAA